MERIRQKGIMFTAVMAIVMAFQQDASALDATPNGIYPLLESTNIVGPDTIEAGQPAVFTFTSRDADTFSIKKGEGIDLLHIAGTGHSVICTNREDSPFSLEDKPTLGNSGILIQQLRGELEWPTFEGAKLINWGKISWGVSFIAKTPPEEELPKLCVLEIVISDSSEVDAKIRDIPVLLRKQVWIVKPGSS
jgi:hypothetical protein